MLHALLTALNSRLKLYCNAVSLLPPFCTSRGARDAAVLGPVPKPLRREHTCSCAVPPL